MFSMNHLLVRNAIQNCGQLEGEAVYQCLKTFLGEDGPALRTFKEVSIRSFGIRVISLTSYGHLMSMQGAAPKRLNKAFTMLLVYLFFPEILVAQLFTRVMSTAVRSIRESHVSYRYWVATCLGNHVCVRDDTVPLGDLRPAHVRSERASYNLIWLGRFIVLNFLLVQYLGSLGIWYRSLLVFKDWKNAYDYWDAQNSRFVSGGLVAVLQSLSLTLLNLNWKSTLPTTDPIDLATVQQDREGTNASVSSTETTPHPISRTIQLCISIYAVLRCYLWPEHIQRSIEGAVAMRCIMGAPVLWLTFSRDRTYNLQKFIREKQGNAVSLKDCHDGRVRLMWWKGGPLLILKTGDISMQRYIGLVLVLASATIRSFARYDSFKRYAPRVWRVFDFLNAWFADRKSFLSALMFLVVVSLHLWIDLFTFFSFVSGDDYIDRLFNHGSHWDRLAAGTAMYKDPWYDNMYIL